MKTDESCDLLGVPKCRVSQLGSLQLCCDFLPALATVPCETLEGGVLTVDANKHYNWRIVVAQTFMKICIVKIYFEHQICQSK